MLARALLGAIVALTLVLSGAAPAGAAGASRCAGAETVPSNETERRHALKTILCLVDAERAERRRPALRRSSLLAGVAQRQSADMVRFEYVGHVNRRGQSIRTRVSRAGYPARHAGEAIGWTTGANRTAAGLMRRILVTAAHRRAIFGTRYRDIGVGLVLAAPVAGRPNGATLTLTLGRRR